MRDQPWSPLAVYLGNPSGSIHIPLKGLGIARIAMTAIEILDLEKSYLVGFWRKRAKLALRPLRLTIEEGEVFGFLGPNGAGKTTTLKLLMGLVFPTAGRARILGMEIDDPRVKSQIGFLPEQPYFYDQLSARELQKGARRGWSRCWRGWD